jgi:hypothetical protein
MISVYHIDVLHSEVGKADKEERKPEAVYEYSQNMGAIYLRDQMMQPCLHKWKEGFKRCIKLFRMLFSSMRTYQSMLNNKGTELRLVLLQALLKRQVIHSLFIHSLFFLSCQTTDIGNVIHM